MDSMRYINIIKPGSVEISEMPIPKPGPGEVIIKLLRGGICGSDLGTYRGSMIYASYPRIPGHEFSAEVVELGRRIKN